MMITFQINSRRLNMANINSFGFIGGDKRQLYCAASAAQDGYGIFVSGFEKCGTMMGLQNIDIKTTIDNADALILPVPVSKDGLTLHAPLAEKTISLEELFNMTGNKPVFCGMKQKLPCQRERIFDYSQREEFAVANAVPTSEGAIETAMLEYEGTISSSRCLVTGYGRIGRVLSDMLKGLGADVTVSARNLKDLAFIRAAGMKAIPSDSLHGSYDLIFNTVPYRIFDAHTLAKTAVNALVIDLASLPGGVDGSAAERLGIKVIHALSLPGKVAPKSSGIIIKNAVYNIIREESL